MHSDLFEFINLLFRSSRFFKYRNHLNTVYLKITGRFLKLLFHRNISKITNGSSIDLYMHTYNLNDTSIHNHVIVVLSLKIEINIYVPSGCSMEL